MKTMFRSRLFVASLAALGLAGLIALSTAIAQPRSDDDNGGGDQARDQQPPPPRGDRDGPGDRGGPGGQGGSGGFDGGRRFGPGDPSTQLRTFREMFGLIDDFQKIAASPSAMGVATVMRVNEQFRDPHSAVEFLEKMLPLTKDETVVRAIRFQLSDLYKRTDQHDKAMEQLEKLITEKN